MAIKVNAGGGIQVIPNAKEVLKKIQEYMPPKRYMHYFKYAKSNYKTKFSVLFSIPGSDSPSSVASNVVSFLSKNFASGEEYPCTGTCYGTDSGDKTLYVAHSVMRHSSPSVTGVMICCTSSSGVDQNLAGAGILFRDITWLQSIEI